MDNNICSCYLVVVLSLSLSLSLSRLPFFNQFNNIAVAVVYVPQLVGSRTIGTRSPLIECRAVESIARSRNAAV